MYRFLLILATVLAAAAPATVERSISPGLEQRENLDDSNGLLRLPGTVRQMPGEPIVFEAEDAAVLRFTAGKAEVVPDSTASGGVAVAHIQHAEYHFEAVTSATYTAWYRASYPRSGNWHHAENMDGMAQHGVPDSQGEMLDTWLWHSGPTYDIAAGQHSWNLTPYGFMGGAKLDKLLLLPAGGEPPTDRGPAISPSLAPIAGTAITDPVAGRRVLAWQRLAIDNLSDQGTVRAWWSVDDGAVWTAVPPDGSLAAAPAGQDLSFRLELTRDDAGRGPILAAPVVHFQLRSEDDIVLQNDRVEWRFAGEDGAVVGLVNKVTGASYIADGVRSPLFAFRAIRGRQGQPQDIWFNQGQLVDVEKAADRLVFHHSFLGGRLSTALTVQLLDQGLTRFSLTVENRSEWSICETKLPHLYGLRIGADETDDRLLWPTRSGHIADYPARLQSPEPGNPNRGIRWPGSAFVCFTDLYDANDGGLYLACYDREIRYTDFSFAAGYPAGTPGSDAFAGTVVIGANEADNKYAMIDPPAPWIHLGFVKQQLVAGDGQPVTLPEVIVGVHQGDWHWAADRYREWAASWMRAERDVPDWIRDLPGYVDSHMSHLGSFVDLAKGSARAWTPDIRLDDPPFPLVVMWAQQTSAEAAWATPVLHYVHGTVDEFAGGIRKLNEMGTRFICYSLPPRINPVFHRGARRNGIVPISMIPPDEVPPEGFYEDVGMRNYRGELVNAPDLYGEGLVDFCNPRWQAYLRHILLDKYIAAYGTDGMYLDAMGLGGYRREMRAHDAAYGDWHRGWQAWMRDLRASARQLNPDAVFLGEGVCDVDMQLLDFSLFYTRNAPEVYRYTIPWGIGVMHYHAGALYDAFADDEELAMAIVLGIRVGVTSRFAQDDPDGFRAAVAFWNKFNQWQFRARFVDEQGVTVSAPVIPGKLYVRDEAANRGALWVGLNRERRNDVELRVARRWIGQARIAHFWDDDGQEGTLPVRAEGDDWVVTLPPGRLLAVLLAERCEPLVELVGRPRPICPGGRGTVRARVRHLGPGTAAGKLRLRLPDGWAAVSADWELDAGQNLATDLTITVPAGESFGAHNLYVVGDRQAVVADRCDVIGVCRPVLAEIHWQTPSRLQVAMQNRSDREITGICTLELPAPAVATANDLPFQLPPGDAGTLVFDLDKRAGIVTREHLKARLSYEGIESLAYELLQPALLNGGFEQCVAGDGRPDYWNYRKPNPLYRTGYGLDADVKRSGRYSLRIEPQAKTLVNNLQQSFVQVIPGQRYRLSGWVRRDAAIKGVGIQMIYRSSATDIVNLRLEPPADAAADAWHYVEQTFATFDRKVPCLIICYNHTKGAATAWFDDLELETID